MRALCSGNTQNILASALERQIQRKFQAKKKGGRTFINIYTQFLEFFGAEPMSTFHRVALQKSEWPDPEILRKAAKVSIRGQGRSSAAAVATLMAWTVEVLLKIRDLQVWQDCQWLLDSLRQQYVRFHLVAMSLFTHPEEDVLAKAVIKAFTYRWFKHLSIEAQQPLSGARLTSANIFKEKHCRFGTCQISFQGRGVLDSGGGCKVCWTESLWK